MLLGVSLTEDSLDDGVAVGGPIGDQTGDEVPVGVGFGGFVGTGGEGVWVWVGAVEVGPPDELPLGLDVVGFGDAVEVGEEGEDVDDGVDGDVDVTEGVLGSVVDDA